MRLGQGSLRGSHHHAIAAVHGEPADVLAPGITIQLPCRSIKGNTRTARPRGVEGNPADVLAPGPARQVSGAVMVNAGIARGLRVSRSVGWPGTEQNPAH